jgi:hypothetical protein
MRKRKRANRIGQYTALPWAIKNQPAWRAMSPGARLLWIELRGWLRNDWSNNGRLFLACRKAAEAIRTNKDTIARQYTELEHFGFLHKTSGAFLGSDGHGIAAHYRFTDLPHGTHAATRDYEKWDGAPFVCWPRRPGGKRGPKKQNPVCRIRTPRMPYSDIRKGSEGGSVGMPYSDIGTPAKCMPYSDISSFPLPPQGKHSYRVAQQLERQRKLEEPVRARPLFPA